MRGPDGAPTAAGSGASSLVADLSQPYRRDMPAVAPHGRPDFDPVVHELSGTPFSIGRVSMSVHTGTHVDAPRHAIPGGKTLDEYPLDQFVGSGVALDVRREGAVGLTAAELSAARPEIRVGDIVLLHFGYAHRFGSEEYRTRHPYLAEDATQLLVDRKVRMVGLDLQTPDLPASLRPASFAFPAHTTLLRGDCLILENLGPGLANVVGHRLQIAAVPLSLPAADGSPVRPIAWTGA